MLSRFSVLCHWRPCGAQFCPSFFIFNGLVYYSHFFENREMRRKPVADDTLWPIYSRNEPRYFILNGELRGIGHGPRATACAFWNEFMPLITARQSTTLLSACSSVQLFVTNY